MIIKMKHFYYAFSSHWPLNCWMQIKEVALAFVGAHYQGLLVTMVSIKKSGLV